MEQTISPSFRITAPGGIYKGQAFDNAQPLPLNAETANFESYKDRVMLASLGIFSSDRHEHRAKREHERRESEWWDNTYELAGLDRRQEYKRLAAQIAHLTPEGIWPWSTRLHARVCSALDQEVAEKVYGK